jgi:hypothetical protein
VINRITFRLGNANDRKTFLLQKFTDRLESAPEHYESVFIMIRKQYKEMRSEWNEKKASSNQFFSSRSTESGGAQWNWDSAHKKPACGEVNAKGPHPISV